VFGQGNRRIWHAGAAWVAAAMAIVALAMVGQGRAQDGRAELQTAKLFRNRQRQNLMHSLV